MSFYIANMGYKVNNKHLCHAKSLNLAEVVYKEQYRCEVGSWKLVNVIMLSTLKLKMMVTGYRQLVPRTSRKQTTRTMSDGISRELVPHHRTTRTTFGSNHLGLSLSNKSYALESLHT